MNKKYNTYFQNAYTSVPIQDNFNQIQFIPNGLARIEYIALEILCAKLSQPKLDVQNIKHNIEDSIAIASLFINEIDEFKTEILETKESNLQIIQ